MKKFLALITVLVMSMQMPLLALAETEAIPVEKPAAIEENVAPTETPATETPATEIPATEAPATEVPATEVPATEVPATEIPATEVPATEAPATELPATEEPAAVPAEGSTFDLAISMAMNSTVRGELTEAAPVLYYALQAEAGDIAVTADGAVTIEVLRHSGRRIELLKPENGVVDAVVTVEGSVVLAVSGNVGTSFSLKAAVPAVKDNLPSTAEPTEGATTESTAEPTEEATTESTAEPTEEASPAPTVEGADEAAALLLGVSEQVLPFAVTLALNGTEVRSNLTSTVNQATYAVQVTARGLLTVYLNPQALVEMTIYDESTNNNYSSTIEASGNGNVTSKALWLDPGIYHIMVNRKDADTSFSIRAAFVAAGNNINGAKSFSTAYAMADSAAYVSGVFTEDDHSDYLLYNVSAAGKLAIETRTYMTGGRISVFSAATMEQVYTEVLSDGTANAPASDTQTIWLESGPVFILVSGGGTGKYDIRTTLTAAGNGDTEPNNGFGTANSLTLNGTAIRGLLSETDDADYFLCRPTQSQDVVLSVNDYTNGLGVKVYVWEQISRTMVEVADLTKQNAGSSESSGYEHQKTIRMVANALYYVKIYNTNNRGLYTISARSVMSVQSVTISPSNKVALGTYVTATSVVTGGTPVTGVYQIEVKAADGTYSVVGSSVGVSNTLGFTPPSRGTYRVTYLVYDGYVWTGYSSDDFVVVSNAAVKSVTVAGAGSKGSIQTVTVTADPNCASPIGYAYDVVNSAGVVVGNRVYSASNVYQYTASSSGIYFVIAYVYDGKAWAYGISNYYTIVSPLSITGLTSSTKNTTINTDITFTMTTNGGDLMFTNYDIYCDNVKIDAVTKTSGDLTHLVYRPQASGTYFVRGAGYDGSAWHAADSAAITVSESVQLYALTPSGTQNTSGYFTTGSITFTLTANTTNAGSVTYRLYNSAGTIIQTYTGAAMSHAFTINTPGNYMCQAIKSVGTNTLHVETSWFSVVAGQTVINGVTLSSSSLPVGTNIRATLSTSGANVIFTRYRVIEASTGREMTSWDGNSHSYTYGTSNRGTYFINVIVYDGVDFQYANSSNFTVY